MLSQSWSTSQRCQSLCTDWRLLLAGVKPQGPEYLICEHISLDQPAASLDFKKCLLTLEIETCQEEYESWTEINRWNDSLCVFFYDRKNVVLNCTAFLSVHELYSLCCYTFRLGCCCGWHWLSPTSVKGNGLLSRHIQCGRGRVGWQSKRKVLLDLSLMLLVVAGTWS